MRKHGRQTANAYPSSVGMLKEGRLPDVGELDVGMEIVNGVQARGDNFSRHVEITFLRFNVAITSPGDGSKSSKSTNPISFCVAA